MKNVKNFNNENKYDFNNDNNIKNKYIEEFWKKVKFLDISNKNKHLSSNIKSEGLELQKIYLFNIIILSECIDIITVPAYGVAVSFILSEDFRNSLVYNTVEYYYLNLINII